MSILLLKPAYSIHQQGTNQYQHQNPCANKYAGRTLTSECAFIRRIHKENNAAQFQYLRKDVYY